MIRGLTKGACAAGSRNPWSYIQFCGHAHTGKVNKNENKLDPESRMHELIKKSRNENYPGGSDMKTALPQACKILAGIMTL